MFSGKIDAEEMEEIISTLFELNGINEVLRMIPSPDRSL